METSFLTALRDALWPHWLRTTGAFIQKNYDVLAVGCEFVFPLHNPETGGESKSFVEAGRMDLILRHRASGMVCAGEHRTDSDDIGPASDFWRGLKLDTQVSKHCLAAQMKYPDADLGPVVYNVVRRPAHRPCAVPLVDADGVRIVHDSAGRRVRTRDGKKWRETGDAAQGWVLQTRPETPEEFRGRVALAAAAEPDKYFQCREVSRLAGDLEAYMEDAWAQSQQILYFRRRHLHPRNPRACHAYGRCPYWRLCTGQAEVQPAEATRLTGNFYPAERRHPELTLPVEIEGRQLLTSDRIGTLRDCAKKHYYRYEEPVEVLEEESEALRFGALWRQNLEDFFRGLIVDEAAPIKAAA